VSDADRDIQPRSYGVRIADVKAQNDLNFRVFGRERMNERREVMRAKSRRCAYSDNASYRRYRLSHVGLYAFITF
jgi:hypothetical protein